LSTLRRRRPTEVLRLPAHRDTVADQVSLLTSVVHFPATQLPAVTTDAMTATVIIPSRMVYSSIVTPSSSRLRCSKNVRTRAMVELLVKSRLLWTHCVNFGPTFAAPPQKSQHTRALGIKRPRERHGTDLSRTLSSLLTDSLKGSNEGYCASIGVSSQPRLVTRCGVEEGTVTAATKFAALAQIFPMEATPISHRE